jgi:hypothetical protein
MLDDEEPPAADDRWLAQARLLPVLKRNVTEARLRHSGLVAGDLATITSGPWL